MADIEGRALDEAVAKAMGTFREARSYPSTCPTTFVRSTVHESARFSNYSTDAAHIPEMIAWLIPKSDSLYKQVGIVASDDASVTSATILRHGFSIRVGGATISESLSRLVVAVAQARKP